MKKQNAYYFEKPGLENTEKVIDAVRERCAEGDIQAVVLASSTGDTAQKFIEALSDEKVPVVCVTYHSGFHGGDTIDLDDTMRNKLESEGMTVVRSTHALSGVSRAISTKFGGITPVEIIANTLRLMGQGMKVAVEISVMAADAGAVTTDKDIIAVGGSGKGADTAVVLHPAHMNNFFDLKIREILAKPRL